MRLRALALLVALLASGYCATVAGAQDSPLDQKVRRFLEDRRGSWRDMNVPWQDGQLLHDLIVKHRFTRALEIGTSTGHSAIWMAWGLSKTGGRLVTIEIDPERHAEAVKNFEAAGLAALIDARLGDAHQLVKQLAGPFDFAFSDADKGWYTQYFKDVDPKLQVGGCFTAHNVNNRYGGGAAEFLDYVRTLPSYETTVAGSREGVSISFKRQGGPGGAKPPAGSAQRVQASPPGSFGVLLVLSAPSRSFVLFDHSSLFPPLVPLRLFRP